MTEARTGYYIDEEDYKRLRRQAQLGRREEKMKIARVDIVMNDKEILKKTLSRRPDQHEFLLSKMQANALAAGMVLVLDDGYQAVAVRLKPDPTIKADELTTKVDPAGEDGMCYCNDHKYCSGQCEFSKHCARYSAIRTQLGAQ